MKLCDYTGCQNWAQWRIMRPNGDTDFACTTHKDETVVADEDKKLRFAFIGAAPFGAKYSKFRPHH